MDPRSAPPEPPRRPQDEPVAPEPAWEEEAVEWPPESKLTTHFNRERFLLRCVAWIIGVQFSLFVLAGLMCSYTAVAILHQFGGFKQGQTICPGVNEDIRRSTAESLAVLLALLGGGAIAVGEERRRRSGRLPPPR